MRYKLFILMGILFLSACTVNHGNFTVLSNKIVNTKDFSMGEKTRIRNVKGTDDAHIIIFFPTGNPTISGALNNAFEKTDTDVMTDVNLKIWFWWIPYIYGNTGWEVTGDAVKTRDN